MPQDTWNISLDKTVTNKHILETALKATLPLPSSSPNLKVKLKEKYKIWENKSIFQKLQFYIIFITTIISFPVWGIFIDVQCLFLTLHSGNIPERFMGPYGTLRIELMSLC